MYINISICIKIFLYKSICLHSYLKSVEKNIIIYTIDFLLFAKSAENIQYCIYVEIKFYIKENIQQIDVFIIIIQYEYLYLGM